MKIRKYKLVKSISSQKYGTLYRIKAIMSFGNVKKGDIGGYVQCEEEND